MIETYFWYSPALVAIMSLLITAFKVGRRIPLNFLFLICLSAFSIITRSLKELIFGGNDGARIIMNGISVVILQMTVELVIFEILTFKAKVQE